MLCVAVPLIAGTQRHCGKRNCSKQGVHYGFFLPFLNGRRILQPWVEELVHTGFFFSQKWSSPDSGD